MRQDTGQHVVMPPPEFSDLIVIQAKLGFSFLETLFDGPSQAAEPYEEIEPGADWRIAHMKFVNRVFSKASAYKHPDFLLGQTVV